VTDSAAEPTYVVAFAESAEQTAVEAVLGRVVAAGGQLVVVAGSGVVVRVAESVAESLAAAPAVTHVGRVALPTREPVRIRRRADGGGDGG
jgi:hypothetical protein